MSHPDHRTVPDHKSAPAHPNRPENATAEGHGTQDLPRATPVTVGLVAVAALGVFAGLVVTGTSTITPLGDPGPLVRWGLPLVTTVVDLTATLALGSLLLAATALPSGPAWALARRVGVISTTAWAVAAMLRVVLDYASVAGTPLGSTDFGSQLQLYVTQLERGQLLLGSAALAAVTSVVAVAATSPIGAGIGVLGASAALLTVSFTGHSAGSANHELAVSSLWLHLLGAGIWVGGLATLLGCARRLTTDTLAVVLQRYSRLALLGFCLVVASGLGNAVLRLGSLRDLGSQYGGVLAAKVVLFTVLGVLGWQQRQRVVQRPASRRFARLAAAELALMGLASGLGVALAASAPPVSDTEPVPDPTPAELITGEPLPPPMTLGNLVAEFTPDILWLAVVAFLAVAYLAGVRTLRRRHDAWPVHRTVLWLLGLVALLYVTCGGIAVYGRVYFSAHMIQHMALTMVAPLLLTFGAPITLLLRTCPARHDGSRGPREWVMGLIESRWVRFLAHPVVAAVNFAGSIILFYFSPLFGLALRTHVGHELMMVHFVLSGYLFAQAIVGIDPGPARLPYPLRLVLLFATMGFHAFFGVTMMGMSGLIEATYFSSLGTGIDLLADQQRGGALAWGIGEIPTVILAVVMAVEWSRSDDRESRRRDRAADRDGEAELDAYNAMLSDLTKK